MAGGVREQAGDGAAGVPAGPCVVRNERPGGRGEGRGEGGIADCGARVEGSRGGDEAGEGHGGTVQGEEVECAQCDAPRVWGGAGEEVGGGGGEDKAVPDEAEAQMREGILWDGEFMMHIYNLMVFRVMAVSEWALDECAVSSRLGLKGIRVAETGNIKENENNMAVTYDVPNGRAPLYDGT